ARRGMLADGSGMFHGFRCPEVHVSPRTPTCAATTVPPLERMLRCARRHSGSAESASGCDDSARLRPFLPPHPEHAVSARMLCATAHAVTYRLRAPCRQGLLLQAQNLACAS